MVAVRMARAFNMSVEETARILIRCPMWIREWLRRYDEGRLKGLRDRQMRKVWKYQKSDLEHDNLKSVRLQNHPCQLATANLR